MRYSSTLTLLIAVVLISGSGLAQPIVDEDYLATDRIPIDQVLSEDGSLDLQLGLHGSIDFDGYRMSLDQTGSPRFDRSVTANPRDDHEGLWLPGDGIPGVYYTVNALAVGPAGEVYIGGVFDIAGTEYVNHVVKWTPGPRNENGGIWTPLGDSFSMAVLALAVAPDGTLYAGGDLSSSHHGIARWDPDIDGGVWSPLGTGLNYRAVTIAIDDDGVVYVGGEFTVAGGQPANKIARWIPDSSRGGVWDTLGDGVTVGSLVRALAISPDGSLYAGGSFIEMDGQPAHFIARWTQDGSGSGTWSALGSGVNEAVTGLAVTSSGGVYAGGRFTEAGGLSASRIAKWIPNGQVGGTWLSLGSGLSEVPHNKSVTLAISGDNSLYVSGTFSEAGGQPANRIARWTSGGSGDGNWSPLGTGIGNTAASALAVSADGVLYVGGGGALRRAGDLKVFSVARWMPDADDGQWRQVGSGFDGELNAVAVAGDGTVYAGGATYRLGDLAARGVARMVPDGTGTVSWHPLGAGITGLVVQELAVAPDGSLYVGGWFEEAGGIPAANIAQWTPDGSGGGQWSAVGSGLPHWVRALAVGDDGSLFASSRYTIYQWNSDAPGGGQWDIIGELPDTEQGVHVLHMASDGTLYVGGLFSSINDIAVSSIARMVPDGTWLPLGEGVSGWVRTLDSDDSGTVYIGGSFVPIGDNQSPNVARWIPDGIEGSWKPMPPMAQVTSLHASDDGFVYAGAGAGSFPNFIRWQAPAEGIGDWEYLDEVVPGAINAMHSDSKGVLYLAGGFLVAANEVSSFFARYDPLGVVSNEPAPPGPVGLTLSAFPNPFISSTSVEFELDHEQVVHLTAYDLLGREVATLVNDFFSAGHHEVYWEARGLASGVYILRLAAGEHVDTRRVVLLR